MGRLLWTLSLILLTNTFVYSEELVKHPTLVALNEASNRIRIGVGLKPCELDEKLCRACYNHANYMAQTGNFSHYTNRGYTQRAVDAGFIGPVQENIAAGQMSTQSVMNTWHGSPGHYAAIVGGYNKVGFGLAYSSGGCPYWCAVYGNDQIIQQTYVQNTYYPVRRGLFRRRN